METGYYGGIVQDQDITGFQIISDRSENGMRQLAGIPSENQELRSIPLFNRLLSDQFGRQIIVVIG